MSIVTVARLAQRMASGGQVGADPAVGAEAVVKTARADHKSASIEADGMSVAKRGSAIFRAVVVTCLPVRYSRGRSVRKPAARRL